MGSYTGASGASFLQFSYGASVRIFFEPFYETIEPTMDAALLEAGIKYVVIIPTFVI